MNSGLTTQSGRNEWTGTLAPCWRASRAVYSPGYTRVWLADRSGVPERPGGVFFLHAHDGGVQPGSATRRPVGPRRKVTARKTAGCAHARDLKFHVLEEVLLEHLAPKYDPAIQYAIAALRVGCRYRKSPRVWAFCPGHSRVGFPCRSELLPSGLPVCTVCSVSLRAVRCSANLTGARWQRNTAITDQAHLIHDFQDLADITPQVTSPTRRSGTIMFRLGTSRLGTSRLRRCDAFLQYRPRVAGYRRSLKEGFCRFCATSSRWTPSMISNRSVPTDAVLPHILYRDLEEAVAWLSNHLVLLSITDTAIRSAGRR